ncbi:MAG: FG-GAP repeat protein, partial [Phycisphaerales bacterium]
VWTQQAKLFASDGATDDSFGFSVSIFENTVVAGAYGDDTGSLVNSGAAYVFVRNGSVWNQQAKLIASDAASSDNLGTSVSVSGDSIIAGAYGKDVGGNAQQGAAYVFNRTGSTWSQQAKLVATGGMASDQFGYSVDLSGDTAIVGAYSVDIGAELNQGAAYVFARAGETWTQRVQIVAPGASDDNFSIAAAIDGSTQIVGAYRSDVSGNLNQGSAWIYDMVGADFSVANNDATSVTYSSLAAALLPAVSGQQITATEAAWKRISTLDTAGRSLIFVGNDDIRTPSQSAITLGGSSSILVPAGAVAEFFGQLRVSAGASADITGDSFLLGSRGIMTARTNSSLSINAPIAELDGQTRIEQGASLTFAGTATAIGSTTANSDSSLSVGETFNNRDTFTITTGTISAPLFFNHVQSNFFGTSALFGSLFNNLGATTTIRSGTLYVFGSLTNNGTIIGTICSGCTSTPPNMDIGGSLNLGSAANLNMPFLGSTVRVGGNFDCAINSNTRYDMSLATLQLEGNGTEQTLEVMSLDIGPDVNGLDRSISGHYPINTLHIGTS